MIRLGLIGAADPRHGWFLGPLRRRRAGVRIIGLSDPDQTVRDEFGGQYDLPTWADHDGLLDARPSLVAVTLPDPGAAVMVALQADADVLVVPPLCRTVAELDAIAALVRSSGHRVTAVHTFRGHPAATTAKELVESGRLGRPDLVSLIIGPDCTGDELALVVSEAVDLFGWLTGATVWTPGAIVDDPEEAAAFGQLILTIDGVGDGDLPATLEVRRSELATGARIMQVAGDGGAVEWDVRTGLLRASVDGKGPTTVACGPFARPDEWVLNNLLRKPQPAISTAESLAVARTMLAIDRAEQRR